MQDLHRSTWDEPRPHHPLSRVWRDWVLVGLLVPTAVLEGVLRPDLPWVTFSLMAVVGLVPTLLRRRTRPLPMVAIAFGTAAALTLLTGGDHAEPYTVVYLLILVYALVRWGSGREVVVGLAIVLGSACLSMVFRSTGLAGAIGGLAVVFSAIALGAAFRYRAGMRTREFDQVKLVERERLARDLHDTVAHHVSAIAIRARAGLATAVSQPTAAADALRVIEAKASRSRRDARHGARPAPERARGPGTQPAHRRSGAAHEPRPHRPIGRGGDLRRHRRPPPVGRHCVLKHASVGLNPPSR